ncbi:MAG: sugar phosphate isomerase/epimerase [Verrucomicrobia bacterium]|nr:sugar phosphate isomerase/epimerase [Verrucomicrobiota bacterium]
MVPSAAVFSQTEKAAEGGVFDQQFAICNETFRDWPFEKAFAFAAESGYKALEVAPFTVSNDVRDVTPAQRKKVRSQAEAAGLNILGLHWLLSKTKGFHLTSADRDERKRTAAYLGDLAHFCADLGGDKLIFGSPQQRNLRDGISKEKGLEYAAEVVEEALPVLEKTNVTLAFEPLSPKITNFMGTAAGAVELIEKVNDPRCRLVLDCLAMSTEKTSIPEILRKYKELTVHVQVNDPNAQGPGFGDLDFVPILQELRDLKYKGYISVEVFNYKPGPERLARESIEYLKKCQAKTKA